MSKMYVFNNLDQFSIDSHNLITAIYYTIIPMACVCFRRSFFLCVEQYESSQAPRA